MTKELMEKPAKVMLAVKFLYLVVAVGVVRTTITVIRHADVRSPDFLIFIKFMVYVVSLFLIYQTARGKNWARWSLIAIFVISIPLAILPMFDAVTHNPVHSVLGLLQLGLYVVALLFLFHKSSSAWFAAGRQSG